MKTITQNEKLQLIGLAALADRYTKLLGELEDVAASITDDIRLGHSADYIHGFITMDELFKRMDIQVISNTTDDYTQ